MEYIRISKDKTETTGSPESEAMLEESALPTEEAAIGRPTNQYNFNGNIHILQLLRDHEIWLFFSMNRRKRNRGSTPN